jgi:hypothetical protein
MLTYPERTSLKRIASSVMQALTVLLLELSSDGAHLTIDKKSVTACTEKLIKWLQSMAPADGVSERAYNIVCKVVNKQDQTRAMSKLMPHLPPKNDLQSQHGAKSSTLDPQQPTHLPEEPSISQQPEISWPNVDAFNTNSFYSMSNTGNFYPNDMSGTEYLNDPHAGLYEFGQPQMSLFYGNPYQASFDEWDPAVFGEQEESQGQEQ